jgi:hypothetical protein
MSLKYFYTLHTRRGVPNLEFLLPIHRSKSGHPLFFVRCRIRNWVRIQIDVSTLILLPIYGLQMHNLSADTKFCSILTSNWSSSPNFVPKLVLLFDKRWGSRPLISAAPLSPSKVFQVLIENNELKSFLEYILQ